MAANSARRKFMPPFEKVKADHAAGMTPAEMSEAYGICKATVTRFLTKHKLSRKKLHTYPPDEDFIAALQRNESTASMARRFNLPAEAVTRRIYEHRLRDLAGPPPPAPITLTGLQPSAAKVIVTAVDGSKVSVPRIPTIHGRYEVRP